ncbi:MULTISPECIES: hypothetical protein [Pseudomonas]|uniref:hypothetical protein n=1 Tax=Pseudomonas TaxID=286 RepID=UPI002FCD92E5
MVRVMTGLAFMMVAGCSLADGLESTIPNQQRDAIREYHTKRVLGSSANLTNLQPDVLLYRKIFEKKSNVVDQRALPELDPVPMAQIFKKTDLPLGNVVNLLASASGYDAVFHPQINQSQIVKINSFPNSLTDIAEYLTRVTDAQFVVYQEGRQLIAMPKDRQK